MSITVATIGLTNLLSRSLYALYTEKQLYDIINEFLIIFDGHISDTSKALSEYFHTDGIAISADDIYCLFKQIALN